MTAVYLLASTPTPSPPSGAVGTSLMGLVIAGLVFAPILYFLPSVIAILRRNRIAEVLVINTILGWTFFGWFYSLTAALSAKTHVVISPTVVSQPAIQPTVSPDGNYWWDGSVWQPMYR